MHPRPKGVPATAIWADGTFIDCYVGEARNRDQCTIYKDGTGEILAEGLFGFGDPVVAAKKSELRYAAYLADAPGKAILLKNSQVLLLEEPSERDPTNSLIHDKLRSLALSGRGEAMDCGETTMDHPDARVSNCAQAAFESHKSFYARYFNSGVTRYISYGLAGDGNGNILEVVYHMRGFLDFNVGKNEQVLDDGHIRVTDCIKPITLGQTEEGMIACVTPVDAEASAAAARQKTMDTTVCAILEDPFAFNNKMVRVHGHFSGNFEYSELSGDGCSGSIWFAYGNGSGPPSLAMYVAGGAQAGAVDSEGKRILPVPVTLVQDEDFRRFESLVRAGARLDARPQGADPNKFVFHQVSATFVGRVDGVSPDIHAFHLKRKPTDRADYLGFGQMGLFDAQLVLQSVEGHARLERQAPNPPH